MGFWLLIPFIFVRFGLLSILNKDAMKRAASFPPLFGKERVAYWLYQLSSIGIIVYICFLSIKVDPSALFYTGSIVYTVGILSLILSIINFSAPAKSGINKSGLYRLSRNPMYVAYFICFIGCVLLTQSLVLLGIVLLFQITAHWIILSEERWCIEKFGKEYIQYMKKTRRYI